MGDVAMSVPVIRAALAQHPELRITVVSRSFLKPFFNNTHRCDFFAADVNGKHKGFFGLMRLSGELKSLGIDAMADLHGVLRAKITGFFLKVLRLKVAQIHKGRTEKKALTRAQNKMFKPLKTTPERYADVFAALGFPVDLSKVPEPVLPDASQKISEWLKKPGVRIGIAPFAQHEGKVYPADLMQQVIDKLAGTNRNIFLFGAGDREKKQLMEFAASHPNI